ncbi:yippee-domain-containing protein [Coemansia reversa NRRL 1564]|uniref:Protein yippee-like n=1 Tax=Coemansia reversa (strain ATCC 12441 / NRRL 1564) TaxID=763665 RepID=A0A2G5B1H9_COERN|nr:yippee-domain-containing protein [Coemansia reversa NRRL 1564]|eukprot:PIA12856.1 yippee-domain-containing protein [Coemansia reversa NRRL 1564]
MGFVFQQFIEAPALYACQSCRAHISRREDIMSRTFQGKLGRAYLTKTVFNEKLGEEENRQLMTGLHTVCDLYCRPCNTRIGWKYIRAYDKSQQYKEGCYVLEKSTIFAIEHPDKSQQKSLHPVSPPSLDNALARFMSDVGIQASGGSML